MKSSTHALPEIRLYKAQMTLLRAMKRNYGAFGGELVRDQGVAYLGYSRVSTRSVERLIAACAVRSVGDPKDGNERYVISETGLKLLDN